MEVLLDFTNINSKIEFYDYLNKVFSFNEYVRNLDALYDELTSIYDDLVINVKNIENVKDFKIKLVLDDVALNYSNIKIIYQ